MAPHAALVAALLLAAAASLVPRAEAAPLAFCSSWLVAGDSDVKAGNGAELGRCTVNEDRAIEDEYRQIVDRRERLKEPMDQECQDKLKKFICSQCAALDPFFGEVKAPAPLWYMCKKGCQVARNAQCDTKQMLHWIPGHNFRFCC